MPRGSKKGVNPFKTSQVAKVDYRVKRIKEVVIPKIKAMAPHVDISSINKYAKLVCEIYNTELPVSEKPLGLRTVTQNFSYWKLLGAIYYQLFDSNSDLISFKNSVIQSDNKHEIQDLKIKIDRLTAENIALKSALSSTTMLSQSVDAENNIGSAREESLCKLIDKLINASDGVIQVDLEKRTIHDLADDLRSKEGILPIGILAPYFDYLKNVNSIFTDKT